MTTRCQYVTPPDYEDSTTPNQCILALGHEAAHVFYPATNEILAGLASMDLPDAIQEIIRLRVELQAMTIARNASDLAVQMLREELGH